MLYFYTQIAGWQLLKLIRTVCYKMLLRGAKSRVLCYNKAQAITLSQRQQDLYTFLETYKQLKHTYTFKIIFKLYNCIALYTFSLHNRLS